jgi:hypothetical protein
MFSSRLRVYSCAIVPAAGVRCAKSARTTPGSHRRGRGHTTRTAPAGYFTVARGRHLLRLRWSSRPKAGAAVASDSRISEWIGRVSSLQSDWRWGLRVPQSFDQLRKLFEYVGRCAAAVPRARTRCPALRQPSCALRDHVLTGVLSYSQRSLQRWGPASQQRP